MRQSLKAGSDESTMRQLNARAPRSGYPTAVRQHDATQLQQAITFAWHGPT